jgi:hypothetical protein
MLGPADYCFWTAAFLLEVGVVVYSVYRREFFRYFPLNFYMLCTAIVTAGQYYCIQNFGFTSTTYFYFYYYTDSLLTILMLTVIIQLYLEMFKEMRVSRYIKGAALILIVATGLFSYVVVHQNRSQLTTRFVVELGQNLYFVGVVLTYLLWGAIVKLRETRARLVQLVLGLGVFYSAMAGAYALRNLFPILEAHVLRWLPPVMACWLPFAWGYTFMRIPEEARLATARLAVRVGVR